MKKFLKFLSILLVVVSLSLVTSCGETENPNNGGNNGGENGGNNGGNNGGENGGNNGGNNGGENGGNNGGNEEPNKITYTVTCKAVSGKPLDDFYVLFSLNNEDIADGFTNSEGQYSASLVPNNYNVIVEGNEGYILDEDEFTTDLIGTEIVVTCDTYLIETEAPATNSYELGDVMYDFTVVDPDGKEINLVTLFDNYDVVVLNFWYTTCYYCGLEFPYLEQAYTSQISGSDELYSDKVAVVAINPGIAGEGDSSSDIKTYKEQYGLTFDMALDYDLDKTNNLTEPALTTMFGVNAFPTTVVIDKFANIAHIESGAISTLEAWTDLFDTYLDPNYTPVYNGNGGGNNNEQILPDITQPESSVLEAVANGTNVDGSKFNGTYTPETNEEDAKYSWPWIVSEEKNAICPSNSGINGSFSIVYTTITLKKDQVFTFDYYSSTEEYDFLYILVDGIIATYISGQSNDWETCYPYVAVADGTYEVAFCYIKDSTESAGDDTVYIKNLHYCELSDIDKETYIFRECATGELNEFTSMYDSYVGVVYNEEDGYYHVGSSTGPLLLADLLSGTNWSNDSLSEMASNELCVADEVDYNDLIIKYSLYANNSTIGYTPVTLELADALKAIVKALGKEEVKDNLNQWLEVCVYYSAYGTNGVELGSPITGLAPFDCYEFDENCEASCYIDRVIMPRGILFKFVPATSGVYKIYSVGEKETIAWVCDENGDIMAEAETGLRSFANPNIDIDDNFVSYYYYEAGKTYFIRAGFYDIYEFDVINLKYEFVSESKDLLTLCSPGPFTSSDDTMGDIISGNYIDASLEIDGYYHVVSSLAADTFIYCDFSYATTIFGDSLSTILSRGAFDFTKTELDEAADGQDLTDEVTAYIEANLITDTTSELYGCVKVNERFAEILQMLMDKYTFPGVEYSWLKLCYYYNHLGA